jgi:hypothetical protein
LVPIDENELKPDPVKVSVTAAAPTVSGVTGATEVITGAIELAIPTPKPLVRVYVRPLLPAPVLVKDNEQSRGVPVVALTTIVAVPAVGLVIAAPEIALATPLIVEFVMSPRQFAESGVNVPPATPGVLYVLRDNVAPYSKLEPSNAIG